MLTKALNKLPMHMGEFIRQAGQVADGLGLKAYIVGGFVRDLLLGAQNFDIDLVVEGDGIMFAKECARSARSAKLKIVAHQRFGTATLHGLDGFKADIASSRKETYEGPGALPVVESGTIKDDLWRRDFTINAMAVGINSVSFGKLFDFYGGRQDLEDKIIRALHPQSFRDDSTRVLRAVRFEQRLGFSIEKETLGWLKLAVSDDMLQRVHKHRLRDELVLIFREEEPLRALKRLYSLCKYSFIDGRLAYQKRWEKSFPKVKETARWFSVYCPSNRKLEAYVMHMCLFFSQLSRPKLKHVLFEFAFHRGESLRIMSFKTQAQGIERSLSESQIRPSRIWGLLEPLSYEVIMLIYALSAEKVRERISVFLSSCNGMRLHVKGEDLIRLGVKPGPGFRKVLDRLMRAKLDGKLADKSQELAFARKIMSSHDNERSVKRSC